MAHTRSHKCSQFQSREAVALFGAPVLRQMDDGLGETAAGGSWRNWRSWRVLTLGVCVAMLLVSWPMRGMAQTASAVASGRTGSFPDGVAYNAVTNKIYVTNQGSDSVSVIDGHTSAITTVATGTTPHGVIVNSVTNKIYVANEGSASVTVIDGETNETASVAVGIGPYAMALNSETNRIYVANEGSGTVTVIDGATRAATTLAAGILPGAVAVNPATNKIYVVNQCGSDRTCSGAGSVTVIDGATNKIETIEAGMGAGAVAVNSATNRMYVANFASNTVTVIDGATNITAEVAVAGPGTMAVNEASNKIYVVSAEKSVTVIDGASNDARTVSVGMDAAAITVNAVTDKIYLLSPSSKMVLVVDGATNSITRVAAANRPVSMAVNAATNQIFVAAIKSNNVTMIDGITNKATALMAVTLPRAVGSGDQALEDANLKSEERPASVNTTIAAIASPASRTPEFKFTAANAASGAANVYFQVDSLQGAWIAATRNGETFSGAVTSPLAPGAHVVYAYSGDGPDAGSAGGAHGIIGNMGAQVFTAADPEAVSQGLMTDLVPNTAVAGSPAFTMIVNGSGFVNGVPNGLGTAFSVIQWNGAIRNTTVESATQLSVDVLDTDIATPGTATVTLVLVTDIMLNGVPSKNVEAAPDDAGTDSLPFTITSGNNPAPALTSISPTSAAAGGPQLTLTLTGTNFVSNSVVNWNSTQLATTFVSATSLTAVVTPTLIATAGSASVTVVNPTPGGGTSGAQTFTINAATNNPAPTLATISPNSATAGAAGLTMTLTGTGFVSTSVVKWNATQLTTSFVSATSMTATVPATLIASAGSASVTVFSPTPGGGTSSAVTFTINAANNPAPTLTMISPNSATAGAAQLTMTVTGTGFVAASVVNWNGTGLATSFVSATSLTAVVTPTLLASAASASVTVFSPTPGGGTSGALTFTINASQNNPAPTLASISPNTASAGGAAFTLTAKGTGYISTSVVNWNGTALPTTVVSATQLTAAVPVGDIATGGTPSVTVTTPAPGGGTSAGQTFTITDFTMSNTSGSQTVTAGGSAMYTIGTGTNGNFTGTVAFTASGFPTGANGSFKPASVSAGTSTIFTVTTEGPTNNGLSPSGRFGGRGDEPLQRFPVGLAALALALLLAGASYAGRVRIPQLRPTALAALVLLVVMTGYLAACSGSSTPSQTGGTQPGTYTITITGTVGGDTHTANVQLIVQK
jgi:YVTN family beta-propeller protein